MGFVHKESFHGHAVPQIDAFTGGVRVPWVVQGRPHQCHPQILGIREGVRSDRPLILREREGRITKDGSGRDESDDEEEKGVEEGGLTRVVD